MASWREGTSKQYHTYLKRWRQYCDDKDTDLFQPGVHNGVEFLVSLYKAGLGPRSVLAFLPSLFWKTMKSLEITLWLFVA